jgi:hypothetical protein
MYKGISLHTSLSLAKRDLISVTRDLISISVKRDLTSKYKSLSCDFHMT